MNRHLRNNGLTLVLCGMFLASWYGQFMTGHRAYNEELIAHHRQPISLRDYVVSGDFWQATGENWESEFLQMAMFVVLTTFLYQKGSPESRDPDDPSDTVDEDPRSKRNDPSSPWPVRRGSDMVLWLYSHSLSITFLALFLLSVVIHACGGVVKYNQSQQDHGQPAITLAEYFCSSQFWFESLQNWQSEFLSLAAMVWLSVFLRERGSAESKRVAAANGDHE